MNDDDDDPINKALNLGPLAPVSYNKTVANIVQSARNDSAKEDFTFARANIREVVENGNDAIAKLAVIADQSQNPRAFEVLAKLMDSMVTANEKLLEIQQKIRDLDQADMPHDDQAKAITNNLFVGSTADLAKIIENMKK